VSAKTLCFLVAEMNFRNASPDFGRRTWAAAQPTIVQGSL
jgi:hypothetical protein